MTEQTKNAPEKKPDTMLADLTRMLEDTAALANAGAAGYAPEAMMTAQARTLNALFHHLMAKAVELNNWGLSPTLSAALQAQNQCHKTLRRLQRLKEREPAPSPWSGAYSGRIMSHLENGEGQTEGN